LRGGGRIYQQTFIDTYSKVGFAKLYTEKTPITAADLLNDRVRWCYGKTPMQTFTESIPLAKEKLIA